MHWCRIVLVPGMITSPSRLHGLLKSSLFCCRMELVNNCIMNYRRFKSHYVTNLSTRDFVEVINQKAKIHKYLKLQEPEEDSEYINCLETRDSGQNLNVIPEDDHLDFGALSADTLNYQPCHESLISRSIDDDRLKKKSVIDELLTAEPEDDPGDRLRLSEVDRRHPPEYYSAQIIRLCKAGDTNAALSVFFSQMLERDRVLPSRFHAHMLLDGLAKVGDSENAFRVYKKMTDLGIIATQATYSRLFRACAEDISTWYRRHKHFIPPIVANHSGSSLSLLQRKNLALQKALTPDMLPSDFGGPAVNKVYSLWRRLREKGVEFTEITYNVLILALAKAGDIHGCLRALDMMMMTTTTKAGGFSTQSTTKSNKRLIPDQYTLISLLSAIEPATMKRNLVLCHNNKESSKSTLNEDSVYHISPFQLALVLWHELLPYTQNSILPHHFTLLANIMALQNTCLDSNHCEVVFVNNARGKLFQDILKDCPSDPYKAMYHLPTHPSCTSSELASLIIAQATKSSLLNNTTISTQLETIDELTVQKTSEFTQLDWNDTMLALHSTINLLLPTDKPIVIYGPKNQSLTPWQRLALVGGLHGFLDMIEKYYKLKPGLPFMTSLVRLLPPANKLDEYEKNFDIWESEFLNSLTRFKLTPDTGIYNALINRRTSAGVNANHLLADMTCKGFIPDQITWGCLARGCETTDSIKKLLHAFETAAITSPISIDTNGNVVQTIEKIHSPIVRPSFTFFSTLLTTSQFNWDLKAFVVEYMRRQAYIDDTLSGKKKTIAKEKTLKHKSSDQFYGFSLDRRLIASIDIDIALFRELLAKGIIPKDGSPVSVAKTGGFFVPPFAVKSFYRFIKLYKSWLQETPVGKPR
ncbi:unnamed protein product [Heterobilharzia americana]|nr:unnamed protein product [Heterobilharzia americana]